MNELTVTTSNGRSLTVYDAGDPDGRPILFHHGTPASGRPFDPHIAFALEHGVRLISYDRAGYGNSTRHAGRAVFDVVRDVEAIADALALERRDPTTATPACGTAGSPRRRAFRTGS